MGKVVKFGNNDNWLEVELTMNFGERLQYKEDSKPKKFKYLGDEITVELPDITNIKNNIEIRLLTKKIRAWSKEEKPTLDNILNDETLGEYIEKAIEAILKHNGIIKDKKEEKEEEKK